MWWALLSELSEEAKADLQEFEEKERQRKQGRFGGRGRGGPRADGGRGGMAGRGGFRGRPGGGRGGRGDFHPFGMGMGDQGRIHDQRPPLMQVNLGMQVRVCWVSHDTQYEWLQLFIKMKHVINFVCYGVNTILGDVNRLLRVELIGQALVQHLITVYMVFSHPCGGSLLYKNVTYHCSVSPSYPCWYMDYGK